MLSQDPRPRDSDLGDGEAVALVSEGTSYIGKGFEVFVGSDMHQD